jgi:hypothetical protein
MHVSFGLKDKVTFDQLPEQIREHYPDSSKWVPTGRNLSKSNVWLKETQACLQFSLESAPDDVWVNIWEKTKDDWVLTDSFIAS